MKMNFYQINVLLKSGNELNSLPYSKSTKNPVLYKLFKEGFVNTEATIEEVLAELRKISRIHTAFIFQLTQRTFDNLHYRYFVKNDEFYFIEGTIVFEEFNKEKLK